MNNIFRANEIFFLVFLVPRQSKKKVNTAHEKLRKLVCELRINTKDITESNVNNILQVMRRIRRNDANSS